MPTNEVYTPMSPPTTPVLLYSRSLFLSPTPLSPRKPPASNDLAHARVIMETNQVSAPQMPPSTNALLLLTDESGRPSLQRRAKPGGPGSPPRYTATNFDDDDDPNLDELERRVIELKRELERARLTRDRALSRRAPMRKVPNELLARVFDLGAYGDIFFGTTLCEVNRHWRNLVIVASSVWTNVVLNPQWQLEIDAFLRRITVFLERAQHCPLLVDLDLYCVDNEQRAHDVLQVIAPHVSLCFSFSISVPQPEWMDFIDQHFGGEMATKVEKMALRFKPTSPWAAEYVQSTILQGAMPLLHTLCLEGLPLTILDAALPGLRTLEYKQFEDLCSYPQNYAAIAPMSDLTTTLLIHPDDSGLPALHLRAMRACIPHHSTVQINVNWHLFHAPSLNLRIQCLVIFLFLTIIETTSAAFTREAAYRLDQVRSNSAGTYCFHPRTLPGRIASCMDQSLSMLLDMHVNNKHGPGLSISYYDTHDLSVLGGADWREWNTTGGQVGVCLSGAIEGIDGSYLTVCRFAAGDDDHNSPAAQASKCAIDRPQQRVVDGCYTLPVVSVNFKLSGPVELTFAIAGLALAILGPACAVFKWMKRRGACNQRSRHLD